MQFYFFIIFYNNESRTIPNGIEIIIIVNIIKFATKSI